MARLILFGATGDLARRKLFPALAAVGGDSDIIAVGRREYDQAEFLSKHVPEDDALRQRITYRKMDFTDPTGYRALVEAAGGNIVYLSVDPEAVPGIVLHLGGLGMSKTPDSLMLVLEKPFGCDAASAQKLNTLLEQQFAPEQLLRIDHYLLKDGVRLAQNLARQNASLGPLHIVSLTVRIMEQEGVGTRGAFYSNTGAIRDVVQNHLLNVASVVASGSVNAQWFSSLSVESAQFGQYQDFTEEAAVPRDSTSETFVRAVLSNERLRLTLETGKGVREQYADIEYLTDSGSAVHISLQPTVGFTVTRHGEPLTYQLPGPVPDAYERLFDSLLTDPATTPTLDPQAIDATWQIADTLAVLKASQPLLIYPRGGPGPQ